MFKKETGSQSPERKIKNIKRLMFFVVALLGLSACASDGTGANTETVLSQQEIKAISTPIPMGIKELQTVTTLENHGCTVPDNYKLVHADGPVISTNIDGIDVEVRGLFTKLQENGIEVPTSLLSENGLALGYEEYNEKATVNITKKMYVFIHYLLTLLHESIHSCTGTSSMNDTPIFDFIDESSKISASLVQSKNTNPSVIDLVLFEGTLGTSTVNERIINLEEILTHGLTHMLIRDSGLFENPELARDINEETSAYTKAIQFFDNILRPEDIQTLLEMKSSRNTTGIYTLLYDRFIEKVETTLASLGVKLVDDGKGTLSPRGYLFTKILSIISDENNPHQEQEVTAILAKLIYNKGVNDVSNDEMNIIQKVVFNLFRATKA